MLEQCRDRLKVFMLYKIVHIDYDEVLREFYLGLLPKILCCTNENQCLYYHHPFLPPSTYKKVEHITKLCK